MAGTLPCGWVSAVPVLCERSHEARQYPDEYGHCVYDVGRFILEIQDRYVMVELLVSGQVDLWLRHQCLVQMVARVTAVSAAVVSI